MRMAKKTSYLTELIERHERWKAEGGERPEEETQDRLEDLSAGFFSLMSKGLRFIDPPQPIPTICGISARSRVLRGRVL
jgi:hypothetical protein